MRWRKHGDVHFSQYNRGEGKTPIERFWSRVDKTSSDRGCWMWQGKPQNKGYGQLEVEGRSWLAHVFCWTLEQGKEPALNLLHSCDTPLCVNPDHLREGTQKDNMQDAKDRGRIAKGSAHYKAQLTDDVVIQVLRLFKEGVKRSHIAKRLDIPWAAVYPICKGVTWRHISRENI